MALRIALFGGSFNPPGLHHRRLAEELAARFDQVKVIPCGPRPDKPTTTEVPPIYRAALADLTFGVVRGVTVEHFDLEQASFTRNWQLDARYAAEGEVWHVVGADLVTGGRLGQSAIQSSWEKGRELWQQARFCVITRPGFPLDAADLPPHHELITLDIPGSSTEIREAVSRGEPVGDRLPPRAAAYLERYGLYRAPVPGTWSRGTLAGAPFRLEADEDNPRARELARTLPDSSHGNPRFITTIGGDGAMLRCIREHWRARLPFFGINAGNLGFLMNAPEEVGSGAFPPGDIIFRQLPMLYLEIEHPDGRTSSTHGFNDAWLERSTSQSAWLEVSVNGVTRIQKLVSDGILVATAAGSTAYARSMGASPLLADTPGWLLVGSNVMEPANWRSALLSTDTQVEIRSLSPERRPVEAYVDGQPFGPAVAIRARISKAAAAELVFCSSHDMAEKIAAIQFHES
ncbi:MAG: NAD(+)/NADH kinase [Verrucomicrobiales bacterium]|nr:NAD(+)/NADH kinase [Verrucomicrobiales bacterium]